MGELTLVDRLKADDKIRTYDTLDSDHPYAALWQNRMHSSLRLVVFIADLEQAIAGRRPLCLGILVSCPFGCRLGCHFVCGRLPWRAGRNGIGQ